MDHPRKNNDSGQLVHGLPPFRSQMRPRGEPRHNTYSPPQNTYSPYVLGLVADVSDVSDSLSPLLSAAVYVPCLRRQFFVFLFSTTITISPLLFHREARISQEEDGGRTSDDNSGHAPLPPPNWW